MNSSFLLLSLFFFLGTAYSSVITLNSTFALQECLSSTGGCSLFNTSIYSSSVLPSIDDSLTLTLTSDENPTSLSVLLYLPGNANFTVQSLQVAGNIIIHLTQTTQMNVQGNVDFYPSSTLSQEHYSWFNQIPSNESYVFTLHENATFIANGSFHWQKDALFQGEMIYSTDPLDHDVITVLGTATIDSPSPSTISRFFAGSLIINSLSAYFPNGVQANVLTVSANSNLSVSNFFYVEQIVSQTSSVIDLSNVLGNTESLTGSGVITISNSTFTIYDSIWNGDIYVNVGSNFIAQNFTGPNLFVGTIVDNGLLTGNVTLNNTYISTELVANNAQINFEEFVTIGELTTQSTQLSIHHGSYLMTPDVTLTQNSNLLVDGHISANLILSSASNLTVTGSNATLAGNLINHGTINSATNRQLNIFGNVTLGSESVLEIELKSTTDPAVTLTNSTIALGGQLKYKMDKLFFKKTVKFVAVQLYGATTVGAFNGTASALQDSAISRDLKIVYSSTAVYIEYDFEAKDVESWMWVVMGTVLAVIVVSTVAVIIKCRASNSEYERIR